MTNGGSTRTLDGQIAMVTGASRGIGRAIATELGRHGATVIVNYRERHDAAAATVADVERAGGRAVARQADVSSCDAVTALVNATMREFGQIDTLVCNAGVVRSRFAALLSDDHWDAMHATGLRGTFSCVKETLPHMIARRRGTIVCVSSIVAHRGSEGLAGYAAVKGGVEAMVRALAVELGPKGIRVNAVAPGVIRTDMSRELLHLAGDELIEHIPQRRLGEPDEIARAVRFLVSDDASYITGAVLHVDGGLCA